MLLVAVLLAGGAPEPARIFSDHAVLQRERQTAIWGTAAPGERVELVLGWDPGHPVVVETDAHGAWCAELHTPAAGGPFTLQLTGREGRRVIEDVMIGEVWLASGQSNMEWRLRDGVEGAQAAVRAAQDPGLRFFEVENVLALEPAADVRGTWIPASPAAAPDFSATAYFFARELRSELGVPIGVISADWGGTPAEAWVSAPGLAAFPEFARELARQREHLRNPGPAEPGRVQPGQAFGPGSPSVLWNGMAAPLASSAIRGVIWYQGESNCERAQAYGRLFPALIGDWRQAFGQPDMPFYFVQIAPFLYPGDTGQAGRLRDAQRRALALPHTGMAVTLDIGEPENIHPVKKREVGERLALWALARTYGRERACSGPLLSDVRVEVGAEGARIRLAFEHGQGLTSHGAELRHWILAGEDRVFHPAEARIEGTTVVVSSPLVSAPVAVRYAWGAADPAELWNAAGLPAASFRTDDWITE